MAAGDWSVSHESIKNPMSPQCGIPTKESEESSSSMWSGFM